MKKEDLFKVFDENGKEVAWEDIPDEMIKAMNEVTSLLGGCMEADKEVEKDTTEKDSKKDSKKIPDKSNIIMFEGSIDENGEVSDEIKDILKDAEKSDTPLFTNSDNLTIVESGFNFNKYRMPKEQLHRAVDRNIFRNRTNIMIDDFDYNLSYMGYEDAPNAFLPLEVIENEFGISDLDIAAKIADILNFSLRTNIFLPMLDPVVDCAYIKCQLPRGKEDLYGDEDTIAEIVEGSATVLEDILQRVECDC